MKFHFRINFDINACQTVEIKLNQVSLFLLELTCRKWQLEQMQRICTVLKKFRLVMPHVVNLAKSM